MIVLWGPLRACFAVNYMLLRWKNQEKTCKRIWWWGKIQATKNATDAHLNLKWSIEYACTCIILKNFFFYLYKEYLILIQCCSVFMEGILGISAIKKALWEYLSHSTPLFHFCTLWNHYKARVFWRFHWI